MQPSINRRSFFRNCTLATASAAVGTLGLTGTAAAIEPVTRNGKPKFKFSLAAYSYRDLLRDKESKITLSDFIDDCAGMNLEGTELTSYFFPQPVTHEYLRSLKQHCFQLGLDVSGTAVGNDFGHPEGDERQKQIAHVKQWVDYAEILGAPVIRIFAGHQKKNVSPEQSHSLMVSAIEECCEYAGKHGVHLALENHGGPTATAEGLLAFVRDVKSPWFGVNLDTGNFRTADPYGDMAKAAPYALNVQVKVAISGPDRRKEPANFKRIAKLLRDANYRGYVVLEYEEKEDPRKECPRYIDELREAFA